MNVLVLDDDDTRHEAFRRFLHKHEVTETRTYYEAIKELDRSDIKWDLVLLDHDLNDGKYVSKRAGIYGSERLTGFDVAVFIVSSDALKRPHRVIVHSQNTDAGDFMQELLENSKVNSTRWEFHPEGKGFPVEL